MSAASSTNVSIVRTGIVLSRGFGALKKMLPAYQFGLGGPLGDGQHYMSWIHIEDMVRVLNWLIDSDKASGIYNATAPTPVTNSDFSQTLAQILNKPHFIKTPKGVLQILFGEMSSLLLASQRVIPKRLLDAGFEFHYPELNQALSDIIRRS